MGKTTVKPGNSHYGEGGRMPSTTGNPSGGKRGNNPPKQWCNPRQQSFEQWRKKVI
ncbi:hypothetical protein [Treponema berlinense]|uniref:hypothetical protein n=1 Tax=Treponema berlinense TaxID=225004 RepID=UPI003EFC8B9C